MGQKNQTKRLCRIALMAAFLFCSFILLSNILYLEIITLMVISVALTFELKDSLLSSLVFGCLLIIYMGLTPWTIMYVIIYPAYTFLAYLLRKPLLAKNWLLVAFGFVLSMSTGLLLDLPFILVNKSVTIYYILTGLKTSIIQGGLTALEFVLIFEPLHRLLEKVKER